MKKICVVTGSRSEYGLLKPLLDKIVSGRRFRLQMIVTGTHLLPEFGSTYKLIEHDGFKISRKVRIPLNDDSRRGIAKAAGKGMAGFADAFAQLKPDLVLLLGDRFDIFSAAAAAFLSGLPIAHLHGGELTEGSIDDGLRHAITKFSTLHFCAASEYRRRIIQLGEDPAKVFVSGAPGIDNIKNLKLISRPQLEDELDFSFGANTALVTFYPSTIDPGAAAGQFGELLAALDHFKGLKVVFTKPAADINARVVSRLIDKYVRSHPGKAAAFVNLGQLRYLSVMKHANVVVGNSSSGIIEAPSFAKPTVNIGSRQKGRLAAASVINCEASKEDIARAIKKAMSPGFKTFCKRVRNPYGNGSAANKIYKILEAELKHTVNITKTFYDLGAR